MRVLLVSHLLPPAHTGGTELYTAELARSLAARGHVVELVATEKDVSRRDLELGERVHEGIPVHEIVNNLYYRELAETWTRPAVDALLARVVERFRPDVVHFQHLMYLSSGCLAEAHRRARAVLFTLHDYWLECPRFGQLVHADGTLCATVDYSRCGTCLPSLEWRQSALARRTGRALATLRRASRIDLAPVARALAGRARARRRAGAAPTIPPADSAAAARHAELARERAVLLRELANRTVDRFVAPSRFLAERMAAHGIDRARLRVVPTGIDRARFEPRARTRGERLRVRFFGTLVPQKGAHVLLEAWKRVSADLRARGELVLHGPASHAPEHVARLEALAREGGARLGGRLGRDELARELARTDVCVVPSTWFENRPLIVLEALATRTPLVVSDLGGLAELVVEGETGWRFPAGDADALARRLAALLADPSALDAIGAREVALPSWSDTCDAMVALYDEVLAERSA